MKLGNVILAIFLWICIPVAAVVGVFFGVMGSLSGSGDGGMICCIAGPVLLFVLGLVVLISGSESTKKTDIINIKNRFCPQCGCSIPFDSRVCPFCGSGFQTGFNKEISNQQKHEVPPINESSLQEHSTSKNNDKSLNFDREIYCSECEKTIPEDALFCPYCGKNFDNAEAKICLSCGLDNKKDAEFCNKCGSKL